MIDEPLLEELFGLAEVAAHLVQARHLAEEVDVLGVVLAERPADDLAGLAVGLERLVDLAARRLESGDLAEDRGDGGVPLAEGRARPGQRAVEQFFGLVEGGLVGAGPRLDHAGEDVQADGRVGVVRAAFLLDELQRLALEAFGLVSLGEGAEGVGEVGLVLGVLEVVVGEGGAGGSRRTCRHSGSAATWSPTPPCSRARSLRTGTSIGERPPTWAVSRSRAYSRCSRAGW